MGCTELDMTEVTKQQQQQQRVLKLRDDVRTRNLNLEVYLIGES